MRIAIVIPARYGSSRFPGKPLHVLAGRSLLERTWSIARAVPGAADVIVATDDGRVADHARAFGAKVVMTDSACPTGSDRTAAVLAETGHDAAVNLQGDAVLTPPWVLEALTNALVDNARVGVKGMVTAAVQLDAERYRAFAESKRATPASGTTVVMDRAHNALYFSKQLLPFVRHPERALPPIWRHIGVYGYDRDTLQRYAALPQSPLELAEGLEQLRALEHGIPIKVVAVDYRGRTHASIDHPDDVPGALAIIAREGELT